MEFTVQGVPIEVTRGTVVLLVIGCALVTVGGYEYLQQSAAVDNAETVDATIEETAIEQRDSGRSGIQYTVEVEFTYQYRRTTYTSDRLVPGSFSPTYDTRSAARSALQPYDKGETATAYVDPADPDAGFLERRTSQGPLQIMALGGLVLALLTLDAIGASRPGQGTELRPRSQVGTERYQTLGGVARDTVHRLIVIAVTVYRFDRITFCGRSGNGLQQSLSVRG